MRRVGCVVAASLLAVGGAFGADLKLAGTAAEPQADRYLLFGGVDLWRSGGSIHGGFIYSPDGLAREGFAFKLLVAGGQYRYQSGGTPVTGRYVLTSAMAGWRIKQDRLELTVFAGPDIQSHRLTPDDLGNHMRGSSVGLRFGADAWYQPSDEFMATGSISLSTIGPNYWMRGALGWRTAWAWLGPEVMALGGDKYHQVRAGVHATAFRTADFEWSAGLGYALDSDDRAGFYARLGIITRR